MIEQVENLILSPSGLDINSLERSFENLFTHQIDNADLYFQVSSHESWSLEDGIVKEGSYDLETGVGVRAISGEKSGFAYADEISSDALLEATTAARAISKHGNYQHQPIKAWNKVSTQPLYSAIDPIETITAAEKVALLQQLDAEARKQDSRVKQVIASIAGAHKIVLIARSDGNLAADIRPLVRVNVTVIVEDGGRRESGSSGGGGRFGYTSLLDNDKALFHAREAVRQAIVNLDAVAAPAGTMPVVLGSGWPGVLLHEAVGHGLEGDFNRKGTSAFSGMVGSQVASPLCTVVDDGTLAERRGSLSVDDEGVPTQRTVLIEDGILKGYLQDQLNSSLMKTAPTGNGRRESYSHQPLPRMTNTFMLPGEQEPEEIIASVKNGLYAVNFGGGQVDITSGKFVFSTSEAYLIEDGKVTSPVKGATLIGSGPEVMQKISMVGNDLQLDLGVGTCGKDGQSVPVGVGQPTLLVDEITVGGTNA